MEKYSTYWRSYQSCAKEKKVIKRTLSLEVKPKFKIVVKKKILLHLKYNFEHLICTHRYIYWLITEITRNYLKKYLYFYKLPQKLIWKRYSYRSMFTVFVKLCNIKVVVISLDCQWKRFLKKICCLYTFKNQGG